MSPPPVNIDGTDITGATIDGQEVQEITIDGQAVFTANPIVDNFESTTNNPAGPYGPSTSVASFYRGSTNDFARVQTNTVEGSFSLDFNAGATGMFSLPGDGLLRYPNEGDTISFLIRDVSQRVFPVALTNVENSTTPNCYGFEIDEGGSTIAIFRYDNGDFSNFGTRLQTVSANFTAGEWYFGQVSLPETGVNEITFELYELDVNNEKGNLIASAQVTDSNVDPTNRGIGWATRRSTAPSTSGGFVDRFRVE
jgi:hypothetical protein